MTPVVDAAAPAPGMSVVEPPAARFFSSYSCQRLSRYRCRIVTHSQALRLFVHIEDLLLGGRVERVHPVRVSMVMTALMSDSLLANGGTHDLVVVILEALGDAVLLVDLAALCHNGSGLLVDLARHCLLLTNDAVAHSVVNRIEETEEAGRDALFFCAPSDYCNSKSTKCPHGRSRWRAGRRGHP